jgi:hypothetical protein
VDQLDRQFSCQRIQERQMMQRRDGAIIYPR